MLHIFELFNLSKYKRRVVQIILDDLETCRSKGITYKCDHRRHTNQGRQTMIVPGSSDEGITADWMESNLGFRMTIIMVNQYRVEEGRVHVGCNAVMNVFDQMNPILTKTQKRCQGDSNNDACAKARKCQCKQLLFMRGKTTKEELHIEYPEGILYEFDPNRLPKLTCNQVVFFDETHIEWVG